MTIHPATFGTSQPGVEDKPHLWPNGAYLGSASTMPHTQGGMSEYMVLESGMLRVLPRRWFPPTSWPDRWSGPKPSGCTAPSGSPRRSFPSVLLTWCSNALASPLRSTERCSLPVALVSTCSSACFPNEAVGTNLAPMISAELTMHGLFRFNDEIEAAIAMLDAHPGIEDVITHEIPAERAEEAFVTANDSEISGKVLVSLWQE